MEKMNVSHAVYRGFDIFETNWGRYIVVFHGVGYPCATFPEATGKVDEYYESRKN